MDSTNSGSNQSSSSGDNEEFDDDAVGSRADLSSFLNLLPSHPPPPVNTSSSSSIFDSFSPYFTPFPFPPPPEAAPLSLEASAAWSSLPPPPPLPPPLLLSASAPAATAPSQPPPPRGTKKRTRASRRAPTTVINTEASNFRAMVQQFTGIAYPPFDLAAASTSFSRPRLNLFDSAALPPPPPFSQKPQNISSADLNLNTTTSQNPSFGPQIGNAQSQILALQSFLPLLGSNQQSIGLQPAIASGLSSWPTGPLPKSQQRATCYTTKDQNQQGSSAPASSSKGEEEASNYTIESWIN